MCENSTSKNEPMSFKEYIATAKRLNLKPVVCMNTTYSDITIFFNGDATSHEGRIYHDVTHFALSINEGKPPEFYELEEGG